MKTDDLDEFLRSYRKKKAGKVVEKTFFPDGIIADEPLNSKSIKVKQVRIYDPHKNNSLGNSKLDNNSSQRRRAELIKQIPEFATLPVEDIKTLIDNAKKEWSKKVVGLDDIFDKILLHIVRYAKTGHTRALLLVGSPGTGKTTVARVFADLLGLKSYYINAPRVSTSRGLYGEAGSYNDASVGEVLEALIKTKSGNPVLIIDEIDKASEYNARTICNLQSEALNLLDECSDVFTDNFFQFPVDVSYCPIILTANELDDVSAPLVDRCEVICFPDLTEEHITNVVIKSVIPELITSLDCKNDVSVDDETIKNVVHAMFSEGIKSIRAYQSVFENAFSATYIRAVTAEKTQPLSLEDIEIARNNTVSRNSRQIGF